MPGNKGPVLRSRAHEVVAQARCLTLRRGILPLSTARRRLPREVGRMNGSYPNRFGPPPDRRPRDCRAAPPSLQCGWTVDRCAIRSSERAGSCQRGPTGSEISGEPRHEHSSEVSRRADHRQRQPARVVPHRGAGRRRGHLLSDYAVYRGGRAVPAVLRGGPAERLRAQHAGGRGRGRARRAGRGHRLLGVRSPRGQLHLGAGHRLRRRAVLPPRRARLRRWWSRWWRGR